MDKEFIPYEQAIALKELGFDEPCFWLYDEKQLKNQITPSINSDFKYINVIQAPLYQQVFRWFREKHGYFSSPTQSTKPSGVEYDWLITKEIDESRILIKTVGYFPTYEKAEFECVKKLIELCKK